MNPNLNVILIMIMIMVVIVSASIISDGIDMRSGISIRVSEHIKVS